MSGVSHLNLILFHEKITKTPSGVFLHLLFNTLVRRAGEEASCCNALQLQRKQSNLLQNKKHSRKQNQRKALQNDQAQCYLGIYLLTKEEFGMLQMAQNFTEKATTSALRREQQSLSGLSTNLSGLSPGLSL